MKPGIVSKQFFFPYPYSYSYLDRVYLVWALRYGYFKP